MPSPIFALLWILFIVVWIVSAFKSKATVRRQGGGGRIVQLALSLAGSLLIFQPWRVETVNVRFVPDMAAVSMAGIVLTAAGIAFAIWARFTIGRNWSGTVTVKQNHELVRQGPYRIVRHPIYSGLLLAFTGTAIGYGMTACLIGVALISIGFWLKVKTEEQFMTERFGAQYVQYQRDVKALIPGIL